MPQNLVFPKCLFPRVSQSSSKLQPVLNILSFLCWALNASVLQVEEEKWCQEASSRTVHPSSLQLLQQRSHNLRQPAHNPTSISFLSSICIISSVSASRWLPFCPGSPNYSISQKPSITLSFVQNQNSLQRKGFFQTFIIPKCCN